MSDSDFEVGDVVRLRSGGPDMTVSNLEGTLMEKGIMTTWFDSKGERKTGVFAPEALEHVDDED